MVFCGKCGKDNPMGAKFCENCGATLEGPTSQQPQTTYASGNWLSREHAGFLPRFVAWIIDLIIFGVIGWIVSIPFGTNYGYGYGMGYDAGFNLGGIGTAITALISLAYYVYLDGMQGATIGKRVMKLKVIGTNGAMPIGPVPGFIRWLIKAIPILNLVAYIFILFDSQKQGLHDKIANTFVVKE
ncbi:MAG: RDD family protein [Candidatus Methanofastidiosum methylothiophilum]|uniref:RDD family protein n=1 Tax=Candidatus Methanofastidiosum methylothiophilum TaxID=1705564 RepID=A0A150ISU8_9EURY|nr:MAG: RDD family protein [Candidatus Methanofastidiosum methylthiophilus]KYC47935.1 MAG: RDD family protein [Candidatus Methanofastidiosum methylthiophilus]KYC50553.1 MAG: RDD family protein [Candidatus Methanofastidiosum methylthiophilus]